MSRAFFPAPHPLFGRAASRLPLGYQQRSPYYWWWQYLRRNDDYLACCANGGIGALSPLYADFGDVRSDDFRRWWTQGERGAWLFAEQPLSIKFGELASAADWQPHWTRDSVMVVAVPLAMSKRKLKGEFARLLNARHSGKKSGRPAMAALRDISTARYRLERNYTIGGLATTLAVYDLWKHNQSVPAKERLTLWQMGKQLNLNKEAIKDAESSLTADRLIGRNVLSATVSRYVRQAKAIIANTGQGRFPLS